MSLQTRLSTLITAIGADIKALQARVPTILDGLQSLSDSQEEYGAVEWRNAGPGGNLLAKLVEFNRVVASVVQNRSELWLRVKSLNGASTQDILILDSDGNTDFQKDAQAKCRAYRSGTTAAIAGSGANPTVVSYNAEDYDTDGMVTLSGVPPTTTRVTVNKAGLYLFHGDIAPQASPPGGYRATFRVGGVGGNVFGTGLGNLAGFWEGTTLSAQMRLNAGDYVEMIVYNSNASGFSYLAQIAAVRLSA